MCFGRYWITIFRNGEELVILFRVSWVVSADLLLPRYENRLETEEEFYGASIDIQLRMGWPIIIEAVNFADEYPAGGSFEIYKPRGKAPTLRRHKLHRLKWVPQMRICRVGH